MTLNEITAVASHANDTAEAAAYGEALRRLRASGVGARHLRWLEAAAERAAERARASEPAYLQIVAQPFAAAHR